MSRNVYLAAYYKPHSGEVIYSPEWMNGDNISYTEIEGKIYLGSNGVASALHQVAPTISPPVFLKKDIAWDDGGESGGTTTFKGGLSCGYHWYGAPDALMQLLFHPDVISVYRIDWSTNFLQEFFAQYAYCIIAIQVA